MSDTGGTTQNYFLLCSRFVMSAQWDRVLNSAREWLVQEAGNAQAHLFAGQALIQLHRPAEAERHLAFVLSAQPENDTAHRFMSVILFEQKRYREADESIQRALKIDPEDFQHWYHLGTMYYQQGDHVSARRFATKARELNPEDPDVTNLLGLCEPAGWARSDRQLERYLEGLELDPENPEIHNNVGVCYLSDRDYKKAEENFRRALFFDPTLKVARENLFIAVKHRDRIYRCLCAPKDFLLKGFVFMQRKRRQDRLVYFLALPVWILAFRYVLAALLLWCVLVWPMVKVYEMLTLGDIRHKTGEIGARRGGFLHYRRWPLPARLAVFAALLIAFWTAVVAFNESPQASQRRLDSWSGLIMFVILIGIISVNFKRIFASRSTEYKARKRSRGFDALLGAAPRKRRWWHWGRRHSVF